MNKWLTSVVVSGIFVVLVVGIAMAVEDTFVIKTDDYEQRRKSAVEFTHSKHTNDYGYTCGECHHDENNNALNDITVQDDVQSCVVCHDKLKGARDDVMVLQNAMHESCVGCHQSFNEDETGDKRRGPAPTRCSACHPRK